jgi:membrane protease YdiL (CAAX protease family)
MAPSAPPAAGLVHHLMSLLILLSPIVLLLLWRKDVIRPGSLRRRGLRNVRAWPWWFWLLCGFVLLLAMAIGMGLGEEVARAVLADPTQVTRQAFMTVGGAVIGLIAGWLLVARVRERTPDPRAAGLSWRLDVRSVALGLLAFALVMPILQATSLLATFLFRAVMQRDPDTLAHDTLRAIHEDPANPAVWVVIAGAVIAVPIIEEIAFRVFLQSALLGLLRRAWLAILLTSAIFAVIHLGGGVPKDQWHAVIPLFILSIALGLSYEWTRRPIVPIVLHMAFNGFNVMLVSMGFVAGVFCG